MRSEDIKITAGPSIDNLTCKFELNIDLMPGKNRHCHDKESAEDSFLLKSLFELDEISQVYVKDNYIQIAKKSQDGWNDLAKKIGQKIRKSIIEASELNIPLFGNMNSVIDSKPGKESEKPVSGIEKEISDEELDQLDLDCEDAKIIQKLFIEQINPAMSNHGGNVVLLGVTKDSAYVKMGGGCQGCGMATETLKQGIYNAIKERLPHIIHLIDLTNHSQGKNPYY